jgi:hypothetical protein
MPFLSFFSECCSRIEQTDVMVRQAVLSPPDFATLVHNASESYEAGTETSGVIWGIPVTRQADLPEGTFILRYNRKTDKKPCRKKFRFKRLKVPV